MMVGLVSCVCGLAYYCAPMVLMRQIVSQRDATPIYLPMVAANAVNALMWFVYGLFGVGDLLIWVPNLIGMLLSGVQLGA